MTVQPLCPIYGECGGCQHQHLAYDEELKLKQEQIHAILVGSAGVPESVIETVVPSPIEYHYRHRLDMKLRKLKDGRVLVGFTPATGRGIIEVDSCPIGRKEVSDFIPQLKVEAKAKLTPKYRMANLVVRTGDDGRVFWGGIGRRSCRLAQEDYLFTEINGARIHYSLDTFFQANLNILPELFNYIKGLPVWDGRPAFFDLYGGVGLFSFALRDAFSRSFLIEDCSPSVELARYNANYNNDVDITIIEGRVEDHLDELIEEHSGPAVAMIDPPRAGLSPDALESFSTMTCFRDLLYLSCNPDALARDLRAFVDRGWQVKVVRPFDFFPKTRHIETFVHLHRI